MMMYAVPKKLTEKTKEQSLKTSNLIEAMGAHHPLGVYYLQTQRECMLIAQQKGEFPNFSEGDFIRVEHDKF